MSTVPVEATAFGNGPVGALDQYLSGAIPLQSNLPFHNWSQVPGGWHGQIFRGFIVNPATSKGLYFLFNPGLISVSYQTDANALPADQQNADDLASLSGATALSIGFELLFDRTFEVAYGNQGQTGGRNDSDYRPVQQSLGVMQDVRAFERLVGIEADATTGFYPTPAMLMTRLEFYFARPPTPLAFNGMIGSANVRYTHFSANMVPVRAVIEISATLQSSLQQADTAQADAPAADTGGEGRTAGGSYTPAPLVGEGTAGGGTGNPRRRGVPPRGVTREDVAPGRDSTRSQPPGENVLPGHPGANPPVPIPGVDDVGIDPRTGRLVPLDPNALRLPPG